jgi:predicted negative regulator of RcsB-dependent stress response
MSRREMKQDPLLIWTSRVSMFMRENLWAIVAGVAAFAVIILAGWVYAGWSDRKHEQGLSEVAQLEAFAVSASPEAVIERANRVISDYGGFTKNVATLYKAEALRSAGEFAEARTVYESVRGKFGSKNEVYSYRAIRGYADVLGALGDYSRAANELQTWVNRNNKSGLAPYALLDAAINYELAENYAGARAALQRILDTYGESQVVGDARRRLKLVEGAVAVTGR